MSGTYYKKVPPSQQPNSYGFKQVSPKELQDIVKRVSRATYSAKLHSEEPLKVNNYEHLLVDAGRRSVVSACSKRSHSRVSSATIGPRRLTEREMSRLLRRLQRPTTATAAMRYKNDEMDDLKQGKIVRAKSADYSGNKKNLDKLRRPTTATLAKDLNSCHLCYEHENKTRPDELDAFDYDYSSEKVVPAEEVEFIVGRISAPTLCSNGGRNYCQKLPEYIDEVKIRRNLPLLSGLERSRNVNEITERLYRRRNVGITPQATQITTY
ncbi:hypothetical protein ACF0H5_023531 [Mactra antiquata]